jgi:putative copper resistance protein D
MPLAYYLNVSLHLLAALVWLGGIFFLALVGAPVLRAIGDNAMRQRLFEQLGRRFRTLGWVALTVLVVTGVLNLYFRGWLLWEGAFASSTFWKRPAGVALAIKLSAVAGMLVLSAVHDFWLGPQAGRAAPASAEAIRLRRLAALVARWNALLGLVAVLAAVRLTRGG